MSNPARLSNGLEEATVAGGSGGSQGGIRTLARNRQRTHDSLMESSVIPLIKTGSLDKAKKLQSRIGL